MMRLPDADAGHARQFLLILAAYFIAQAVLRTSLGGTFEVDEAEMFVMAQDFRLGYGPQLPLYNWMQAAFFAVFGAGTFAVAALKNLLLFATYALTFAGLRAVLPLRLAVIGTLALLLLPNLSWEGQRAGSHSIAMYAAMGGTLAMFARILRGGTGRDFWFLGLALGLGGLAKYNFWLFPVPLYLAALTVAEFRPAMRDRRFLWAAALAGLIVAAPYAWMVQHPEQVLSSTWKFYDDDPQVAPYLWMEGLAEMGEVSLAAFALLILVLATVRAPFGRRFLAWGHAPRLGLLLLRAAGIVAAMIVVAIVAGGVSDVEARWLVPVYVPAAVGVLVWAMQAASPRLTRNFLRFTGGLALLILLAMADIRLRGAGSDSLKVDVLADRLEQIVPPGTVVLAEFYYGGNLKYQRPDWRVLPSLPGRGLDPFPAAVLLVDPPARDDAIAVRLAQQGAKAGPWRISRGSITVPYRFEAVKTRDVPYAIVTRP